MTSASTPASLSSVAISPSKKLSLLTSLRTVRELTPNVSASSVNVAVACREKYASSALILLSAAFGILSPNGALH